MIPKRDLFLPVKLEKFNLSIVEKVYRAIYKSNILVLYGLHDFWIDA